MRNEPQEEDFASPVRLAASEGDMSAVISALENIQCRVAYVPGNRDPATTAPNPPAVGEAPSAPPRLTPHSCNVHRRCLRLAPDLILVGFGGGHRTSTDADVDAKADADAALHDALAALLDLDAAAASAAPPPPAGASRLGLDRVLPGDAVVLLTFAAAATEPGPAAAGAAAAPANGSAGLAALLRHPAAQARVCLHAHSGAGAGSGRLGSAGLIPVVDPGSLAAGAYALLTLARGGGGGWRLDRCDFHSVYGDPAVAMRP